MFFDPSDRDRIDDADDAVRVSLLGEIRPLTPHEAENVRLGLIWNELHKHTYCRRNFFQS